VIREFHEQASWQNPLVVALIDPNDPDGDGHVREARALLVLAHPVDLAVLVGPFAAFKISWPGSRGVIRQSDARLRMPREPVAGISDWRQNGENRECRRWWRMMTVCSSR
jgi:hypothetical protein